MCGGMESMSNAALPHLRSGLRLGNGKSGESVVFDGFWDPYGDQHAGFKEKCAADHNISRDDQDAALSCYDAESRGELPCPEIVPVDVKQRRKTLMPSEKTRSPRKTLPDC